MPEANDIKQDFPVDETWRIQPLYICRTCGGPARIHPQTNQIWGCLTCGATTASVATSFMPASEFDYPAAARVIALWLREFCDDRVPYPVMIANAARLAAKKLESAPKWMERPSEPGWWMCAPDGSQAAARDVVLELTEEDIKTGAPFYTSKVYGPIQKGTPDA